MRKTVKKIFILLFSIFILGFLSAEKKETKDKKGLQEVCNLISSKKITKGDFRQIKLIFRLKREMVSEGVFLISLDDGIVWETDRPFNSSMVVTKDSITQINSQGKKSTLNSKGNANFEQFAKVLSSVFNGNADAISDSFKVEFIGSTESWNINLTPKDSTIKKLIEEIDMAGHESIEVMTIHESNGDYIRYEFMNHIYPASLTDEEKKMFNK